VVESYPFTQYFTDNGQSSGSNDLIVDGSSTPQDFYISSSQDVDRYIKNVNILISDNGASLNNFGALSALTNGVDFVYSNINIGEIFINQGLTTNLDLVRLSGINASSVGDGTSAYRADVSGAGADSYIVTIDMTSTFGFPWGLKLSKGSTDKLIFRINDNLAGIDTFNVIGTGTTVA